MEISLFKGIESIDGVKGEMSISVDLDLGSTSSSLVSKKSSTLSNPSVSLQTIFFWVNPVFLIDQESK